MCCVRFTEQTSTINGRGNGDAPWTHHTVFWDTTPYHLVEYHPTSRVNHLPPFSRWRGAQLHIPEHNIHGHRRENLALTRCQWVYRAPWTEFLNNGIKGVKRWKEKKMKNVWERKGFQPVLMSFIEHCESFSLQSRRCLRYTLFMTRTLLRQHRM